jgi:hypothetical protein
MGVDYTATKDAGRLIPTGSSPDFAGDVNTLIQWLQKGRSFRRVATYALLAAEVDMESDDIAQVDNIDGVFFKYDSSSALWIMHGIARHANAATRTISIATPAVGMLSRLTDTNTLWTYNGSAWVLMAPSTGAGEQMIIPTSVAGTGATVSTTGLVTMDGTGLTVSLNGVFTSAFTNYRVVWNTTTRSAQDGLLRLRVAGTDASGATTYGTQRVWGTGAAATVQNTNSTSWAVDTASAAATAGAAGEWLLYRPAVAAVTTGLISWYNASSTSTMYTGTGSLYHSAATAYDGFTYYMASGTFAGTIKVYGIN